MEVIQNFDFRILDWIQVNLRNEVLDFVMPIITSLGNGGAVWIIITAILLIFNKTREYGYISAIALILCLLVGNLVLKPFIARTRPFDINQVIEILINKPKDFSFPSGHTMSSFAVATVLFYMDRKIGIIALVLAILIGFSRLYLYVHFPSDVIAGMVLGILVGIMATVIFKVKYSSNSFNIL